MNLCCIDYIVLPCNIFHYHDSKISKNKNTLMIWLIKMIESTKLSCDCWRTLKKKKKSILPTMCPNSINLLQASKRLVLTLVPNPQPNIIHACAGTRWQLLNALCQHVLKLLTWSKMLIPSELNYIPLILLSLSRSQVILHLVWLCRIFHMNFKVFYRLKTSWSWLNFGGF